MTEYRFNNVDNNKLAYISIIRSFIPFHNNDDDPLVTISLISLNRVVSF